MKNTLWTICTHGFPTSKTVEVYATCGEKPYGKHYFQHEINLYDVEALQKARQDITHQIHLIGFTHIFDLTKTTEKRWEDHNFHKANEDDIHNFFKNG